MASTQKPPNFRRIEHLNPEGTNFFTWRHQLMSELLMHDLSAYVEQVDTPTGGAADTLDARVETHNNKVRYVSAFILSSVHVNYTKRILGLVKRPWEMIKEISSSCIECSHRNIGYFERQIHSLKVKDFPSIDAFIDELDRLFMCLNQAGRTIIDSSKVSILLSALPTSFETIKTIIENKERPNYIQSVQQLRMHIKENELQKKTAPTEEEEYQKALQIQEDYEKKNNKKDFKCFICGRKGHTARFCYKNPHRETNNTEKTNSDKKNNKHKELTQKSSSEDERVKVKPDERVKVKLKSNSKNYRITKQVINTDESDSSSNEDQDICGNISSAT